MKHLIHCCLVGCAFIASLSTAQGHVVLTESQAIAGSYHKATLRVGHGCNGSATNRITVLVPAGFQGAKPQPKSGWILSTRTARLPQPYTSHGKTIAEDVVELRWTARDQAAVLPDEHFDEFAFMSRLPKQAGPVWIQVLQDCENGQHHWVDIPTRGTSTSGMRSPAVLLDIVSADPHQHHH